MNVAIITIIFYRVIENKMNEEDNENADDLQFGEGINS